MSVPASVAVIVCAYTEKRWDDILAAHRSLVQQSVAADEIVVVVDHNVPLLQRLAAALPGTRVIANVHTRGLSGARNTGVAATASDLVLFLDDDAAADPDWIASMSAPFADDAVVGVGGWAVPLWDPPGRPAWFPEAFLWVVGSSYQGQSRELGEIRNPLGCAMAFRRKALEATSGFSDGIGRVGTHPLGCEETELSIRIARAVPGSVMIGQPAAVVTHRVTAGRTTVRYFLSRCYWEGVSKAVVAGQVGAGAALASERSYTTRVLPLAFVRGLGRALGGQPAGLGEAVAVAAGLLVTATGYLRGRRSVARSAVQPVGAAPQSPVALDAGAAQSAAQPTCPTVWCTELELSDRVASLTAPAEISADRVRVLVRLHGDPLEFVELPMSNGEVPVADIRAELSSRSLDRLDSPVSRAARPAAQAVDRPLVTVVVCTRDRGPELAGCLQRLQQLDYAPLDVLVVDNAPTSAAGRQAFLAQVGADARFRYIVEPRPGLSRARNCGLANARGAIIAYTDDDVAVDPGWVTALVAGFERRDDVGCVTGLVCTATLETPAEYYFDQRVSWSDSCEPRMFDLTSRADDPLYPYAAGLFGTGASMAFRTDLLRTLGGWDEALGAGTRAKGGEDLDMFVRVVLEGRAIAYEPAAIVWHHHRSDLVGLRRQIFGYGTGLSAFLTKHLLAPDTRRDLLQRIPQGMAKAIAVPLGRPGRTRPELPGVPVQSEERREMLAAVGSKRALIAREFVGMAVGPALYAIERRSNR